MNSADNELIVQLQRELATVYENLTATQNRCTELINENRALHKHIDQMEQNWVRLLREEHQ